MVGRYAAKPKGGRVEANAAGEVVFRGSEGLWLNLVVVAALVALMTLWVVVGAIRDDGLGAAGGPLILGGGLAALLLLGGWFARAQRREVVVDAAGVAVRTREGRVKDRFGWAQVERIEGRPMPSHPTRPAVIFHCTDGSAHFIDPLQVHDTAMLLAEAQRRKQGADDAARAAQLQGARSGTAARGDGP